MEEILQFSLLKGNADSDLLKGGVPLVPRQPLSLLVDTHQLIGSLILTEAKAESKNDDSESEEQAKGADAGPAVPAQPQRVALFPGVDPSALKVSHQISIVSSCCIMQRFFLVFS